MTKTKMMGLLVTGRQCLVTDQGGIKEKEESGKTSSAKAAKGVLKGTVQRRIGERFGKRLKGRRLK